MIGVGVSIWTGAQMAAVASADQPPAISGTYAYSVDEGQSVPIGDTGLSAVDSDTADENLIYTVTAISGGEVRNDGEVVTTFTEAERAAGDVRFQSTDYGGDPASFTVTLSDGTTTLAEQIISITVNVVFDAQPTKSGNPSNQTYAEGVGTETIDAGALVTGDNLVWELLTSIAGTSINSSGVITVDRDVMEPGQTQTIQFRASNNGGFVDGEVEVTITAAVLALFGEPDMNAVAVGGGYDPRDFSTANTHGTVTMTPGADVEGNTPVTISTAGAWQRAGMENLSLTAGTKYTIDAVYEEGTSPTIRFNLKDTDHPENNGEHYVTFTLASGTIVSSNNEWGTADNVRVYSLTLGRERVMFDFTPDHSTTGGDFSLGTGSAGDDITIHSFAYSVSPDQGVATKWLAVAKSASGDYGTPDNGNTTIQTSAAAAKSNPMSTIQAAVNAATAGTRIVVQGGTEASRLTYNEMLTFNPDNSGTEADPVILMCDTYLGADVVGTTGSGERSTIYQVNASHITIANMGVAVVDGPSKDTAAVKVVNSTGNGIAVNNLRYVGCEFRAQGSGGRDLIKLAASREVKFQGCKLVADGITQSIFDSVTGIDHLIEDCDFSGECKEGLAPKGGTRGLIARRLKFDISARGGSNAVALLIGEAGHSRSGRDMEVDLADFEWAECHDCLFEDIAIDVNGYDHGTWERGGYNNVLRRVFFEGHTASQVIEQKPAASSLWQDQPTTVPAPHTSYVDVDAPDITYNCRNLTVVDCAVKTGLGSVVSQQNSGTNSILALTEAADYTTVCNGDIGLDNFDTAAFFAEVGYVP